MPVDSDGLPELPPAPSFRLDGRVALVTGASSGIGFAAATALAQSGAHVVMAARQADRLELALAAVQNAGHSAEALVMDVAQVERTARAVADRGPFDVLVNSAGTARHTPALEARPEDFDAVVDVNLRGAFFLAQSVAKGLIAARKSGSIINVSSQMGHVGGPDRAVYCATKHAVEGFTKAMAIEWGCKGIRVNTLAPTFVRTPLTSQTLTDPERVAWIEDKIKLGRLAEVTDLTGAVVYLASDTSGMVTGTSLVVDGGWTAG